MSVSFSTSTHHDPEADCPYCRMPLGTEGVIIHDGPGATQWHAIHKICMSLWATRDARCPTCRRPVNLQSLLSWRARTLIACKEQVYTWSARIGTETGQKILTGCGFIAAIPMLLLLSPSLKCIR